MAGKTGTSIFGISVEELVGPSASSLSAAAVKA